MIKHSWQTCKYVLFSIGDCLAADSSFDWFWGPDGKLKVIEAIEEEGEEYAEEEDPNPIFDWSWGPDGRLKVQDVVRKRWQGQVCP